MIFLFKNYFISNTKKKTFFSYKIIIAMQKKKYLTVLLLGLVVHFALLFGAQAADILKFQKNGDKELLVINVPSVEPRKVFTVPNPERLVVDVPSVVGKPSVSLPENYNGKLIKAARFGQFDQKTSRFVFDLNQGVLVSSERVEGNKLLVEIDGDVSVIPEVTPVKKKSKENKALKVYKKQKSNSPPLIVIDAGHGGVDPGTISDDGVQEKDVVLEYAKALSAKLLKLKKYRVLLTRSDDEFIRLRSRVAMARKADASLFISLHADSAEETSARGLSVYTVSEKSSDKEAEALAARENKSDIIGGMDLSDERADVADILISLAQRETKNNSATFADFLVVNLNGKVKMLPNSHRFAGFAVLKSPDVPSVLVEIGFLSHPQEEKDLKSKAYRNKVIGGIAAGIEAYFRRKASFGMAVL